MTEKTYNDILAEVATGSCAISDNWKQGRAGFGGLIAAIAAEHMSSKVDESRPLRSFMVSFVAPTPTTQLTLDTRILRQGGSVTQATCSVIDADGQVCLHAMGAFGTARETEAVVDHQLPIKAEKRDSMPPLPKSAGETTNRLLPGFLDNFIVHWTGGGIPLSGTKERRIGMWVRHGEKPKSHVAAAILALGDIPPSAIMSHYTRPMQISSLTWSVEFVQPLSRLACDVDSNGWFYLDYAADAAERGYSQQSGTIHSEDGTLVALSRQCMCYFD